MEFSHNQMEFLAPKDLTVAEFIDQFNSYEIHKSKLESIKRELETKGVIDEQAEMLKLRVLNNRFKSHEFRANERINQIK